MAGPRDSVKFWLSASAALVAATHASAQEAPASPPPPPPPQQQSADEIPVDEEETVFVIVQQGDDTRIDRRIYTITDDPIAQSSTMLDVLSRVPSVTVAPSGAVRLLGSENVVIQVDGQPVPGQSLDQVLRSLSGSDIERIEVVTNPSAQYEASASGGIINIVTRTRFRVGLTGSANGSVDTAGSYQLNISPTWTNNAWSYGFRAGTGRYTWDGDSERERTDFASGDVTRDEGGWDGDGRGMSGGGMLTYRPNDRRRVSLNAWAFAFEGGNESDLDRTVNGVPLQNQLVDNNFQNSNGQLRFNWQENGERPGEQLRVNANIGRNTNENSSVITITPAGLGLTTSFLTLSDSRTLTGNAKFDYERPFGERRMLSYGAAIDQNDQTIDTESRALFGMPGFADFESTLEGLQTVTAAYGTYQFPIARWTLLPGVRLEHYRREITSGGGETDDADIDYFPSLHLRRNLAEGWDLDLSYSRRIERPQINRLDPAIRYWDDTHASGGNPDLAPTMTDAFEANLVFQDSDRSFNVTFYDRMSDNIISDLTVITPEGVTLTRPANAGESEQRGAQLILRGPIGDGGFRYSLNGNVLQREFDVIENGALGRRSELEYSGNAQLEYREPNQSQVGADHLQLEIQFQGPQFELQGESDEYATVNVTWRRRLTNRVFGVLTVQDLFDGAPQSSYLRTDDFEEYSEQRGAGTRIRFALTYQFGGLQQQNGGPPPDDGGGFGGGGMGGGPPGQ